MHPKPFAQLIDLLGRCNPFTAGHPLALWRAMLTLADSGIELKFRRLHGNKLIISLREESGGAYCKNDLPDAPPDFDTPPQPTETEEVTTP